MLDVFLKNSQGGVSGLLLAGYSGAMYVIIAPFQIKENYRERCVKEFVLDARSSIENEPGCLHFDVVQDPNDPNRIWLYELYKDEQAFQEHITTPHFKKWFDAIQPCIEGELPPEGAAIGGSRIWPLDEEG